MPEPAHPSCASRPGVPSADTDEFGAYGRELRWAQAFAYENRAEMMDRF
ncbi:hypothetical protein ABFT43_05060 [Gordonia sp. B21]